MRTALTIAALGAAVLAAGAAQAEGNVLSGHSSDGQPCQIIQSQTGRSSSTASAGGVSTSISAGNGHVSGTTSGPAGTLSSGDQVQVKFGNGEAMAATVTNSTASTSSGTTMIASANGKDCIVSKKPGE